MADQRIVSAPSRFSDNDFSRQVFFGRGSASRTLADGSANRMVIIHARSGLGRASVAAGRGSAAAAPKRITCHVRPGQRPAQRPVCGASSRPYLARRQDRASNMCRGCPSRSGVSSRPPSSGRATCCSRRSWCSISSNCSRFRASRRGHFLDRQVTSPRGAAACQAPSAEELSEHPPRGADRAVPARRLSGGFSEEAAEHIPQILDARFRLAPLDLHAAEEAIVGPAAVRDPGLETRPFALDRQAVASILDYLSQRRTRIVGETRLRRAVSGCSWSAGASSRSRPLDRPPRVPTSPSPWRIWAARPGSRTLRDFYREAIRSIPDHHRRRAARHVRGVPDQPRRPTPEPRGERAAPAARPAENAEQLVASACCVPKIDRKAPITS